MTTRDDAIPPETSGAASVVLVLRLAGVVSIVVGLVGGYVWFVDLADRNGNENLRWGFWHNPFIQFPPFNEPFLDASMWVLLACSAAAGVGGIMLMMPRKWGAVLVTWQARVSIVINSTIAFFIVASQSAFADNATGEFHLGGTMTALLLRLGSVAVDLTLWMFLSCTAVREFFSRAVSRPAVGGFDVVMTPQVPRLDQDGVR